MVPSSWLLVVASVVNLGTTVKRRGLGVDVSKKLWISSSSARSSSDAGVFLLWVGVLELVVGVVLLKASRPVGLFELLAEVLLAKASRADGLFELVAGVVLLKASRGDGLFELVKGVVLLESSKAAGFLELDEGGVILELCAGVGLLKRFSLVLVAGVVLAKMSSLFGLLEAGWKRLGLRRRGVVAGVLVRSMEFFVRSLRSCLVTSGLTFFVVAGSDDVEDTSAVVVVSGDVVLVVVLAVPSDVP